MTSLAAAHRASNRAGEGQGTGDGVGRALLFFAPMLVFWVTLRPLTDLTDTAVLGPKESGDLAAQLLFLALFAASLAKLRALGWRRLAPLLHPSYLALAGWLAVSSLFSVDPSLSLRRLALTLIVAFIVAVALLMPRDVRQFARWIGLCALLVVAACYLAVLLVPHLAVHQPDAVVEANLAGNWRGIYDHKSRTGPMMIVFVFVGLFVRREGYRVSGTLLAAAAGVFLLFTGAKQPIALLPFVLILAYAARRIPRPAALVALPGLLGLYNLFLVGSVIFPTIARIDAALVSDPTFTDRTGIWRFAVQSFEQRPVTGWGFFAFWNTAQTLHAEVGGADGYAVQASHSHNSYLDLALTTGLPGLLLALWAIVIQPLRDYGTCRDDPERASLATLFFQIWAFCVFCGALETLFLQRDDSVWTSFLVAILGLRLLSRFRPVT